MKWFVFVILVAHKLMVIKHTDANGATMRKAVSNISSLLNIIA